MALEVYLYNNLIPLADIRKLPRSDEKISLNGTTLIASKLDVILDNTDPTVYDDRYVGSLFYGTDWYNQDAIIYDHGQIIWKGRIKSLNVDEKSGQLTVSTANTIRDMANTACVINSISNVTPAELIYNILTDADYLALTDDDINYSGFNEAIAIQDAADVYAQCVYTIKDNQNVASVISELCRITQSHLYTIDNKICMYQWQEWDGQLGRAIDPSHVVPLSYSHSYDDSKIANYYSIYYDSSGTATQTVPTSPDTASIAKYGKRVFAVPDDPPDTTTSTDYKILLLSKAAADWCGELAISRYSTVKKICKLTVDDDIKDVVLGDQIDLNFTPFSREPAQVIERSYDRDKKQIQLTAEFLNTPYAYFERDTEPPSAPQLIEVLPMYNRFLIKWTINTEADLAGYKVYFTTSPGEWESEVSSKGYSPIDAKNPSTSIDGYYYTTVGGLSDGATYYFKVKAYDTSFNQSADSNIMSAKLYGLRVAENWYRTTGNIYTGITLDINNTRDGDAPDDFTPTYDTEYYDTVYFGATAVYESHIISQSPDTISTITIFGQADSADDIKVQWREYTEETDEYGSWSTAVGCVGTSILEPDVKTLQIRFIFYSTSWADSDTVAITGIS